jgi:xanthine/uracil/vitamin C permease (AzgA family)
MLNAVFDVSTRGSTVRREVLGGVTTFVTFVFGLPH